MRILTALLLIPLCVARAEVKLGLVGGESGLVTAFTQILNNASHPDHVPGARVVAAYRGGRVDKTGEELRAKWKVEITPDVGSLCRRVDAVLIGSGDSLARVERIKTVIAAGKPMFFESPLAANLDEAKIVFKLAKDSGLRWFSASPVRFGQLGEVRGSFLRGASAWGPDPVEQSAPVAEMLYAILGTGCEEVSYSDGSAVGRWAGDRRGTARVEPNGWGAAVIRSEGSPPSKVPVAPDYHLLLAEIVKFFEGGPAPVSNPETLEVFAFLDAAQRSKAAGGAPAKLR